jgi:succinate dehydrogenase (ubiquinone) iron-sulfur subunit
MNVDGRHHLACICSIPTDNNEKSIIGPLTFLGILKDLVVDMTHFYNQYKTIDPYLKRKTPKVRKQAVKLDVGRRTEGILPKSRRQSKD